MNQQLFTTTITEALDSLDSAAMAAKTNLVMAEGFKAVVFSLLTIGSQIEQLAGEVRALNSQLDALIGDVPGDRKVLRVYDWAKNR
jgi:hypothetical protein